jgi:protein-S-isoprenylcysteine O-methyltransferase Ste14
VSDSQQGKVDEQQIPMLPSPAAPEDGPTGEVGREDTVQRGGAEPTSGVVRRGPTIRGVLEIIGLVAAPTALLTAIGYHFGWTFTNTRAEYFGIDYSTLGFSTADYLLRSSDALFVPLLAILVVALAGVVLHALVTRRIAERRGLSAMRRGAWIGEIVGLAVFGLGVAAVFRPLPFPTHYLMPPITLGFGITLAAYAPFVLRALDFTEQPAQRRSRPTWEAAGMTLVMLLVVLSIFWASSAYASALGRGRAQELAESLSSRPAVVVFSRQDLGIDAPGVTTKRIGERESAYRFRYSGLRLLIRTGNKFFLLPDDWSRERGIAIVLTDSEDIRLEFSPGA